MDESAAKARLVDQLGRSREAVLAKLDGLAERDVRRPLTPTGTNLLGLVKHLATWESRYLGHVFDRPFPEPLPAWDDRAARGSDTWVRASESRNDVLDLFARVVRHSEATIGALPLDAPGHVPWWRPAEVTLLAVLLHLLAETQRHAGHADILREQLDGTIGSGTQTVRVQDDAAFWARRWAQIAEAAD